MGPAIAVLLVLMGCCSNVYSLEMLARKYPGCGNIVTFSQFLFIALEGFIFEMKFGKKKPVIPIRHYTVMVIMFFAVSVLNNYALNFNIAMPLHMIFRSGSLIANMVLGIIILKKRYTLPKYLSIVLVSLGIFICTFMSAKQVASDYNAAKDDGVYAIITWLIGIGMLTFALFMSARMGIFQEELYARFGKHPREALFYNHALPLPGFLLLAKDIYNQGVLFSQSAPVALPWLDLAVPEMWLMLLVNIITQYVCIRAVFVLTTECASLTVTLVVTLRKFISLILSILIFKNAFTTWHWLGTGVTFLGTLLYEKIQNNMETSKEIQRNLKHPLHPRSWLPVTCTFPQLT
ncbi:nucleotide sugar transporter SLC35B4 isoform X2 [Petromyzon marinus]|uniref:nucleotide sugar transporter SLC35B4 isoform X2 n=1 Tax=Petromyzon marinus TaxID=7757 RepID=UPI003F72B559